MLPRRRLRARSRLPTVRVVGLFDLDIFRTRAPKYPSPSLWACKTRERVPNGQRAARFDMATVPGILLTNSGPMDVGAAAREQRRTEQARLAYWGTQFRRRAV